MSELAVLLKWAEASLKEMFAHLSLILLLESVELALVTVKVIVIGLLSQVLEDLARWVVEVSWSSLGVKSLTLILRLRLSLRVEGSCGATGLRAGFFSIGWSFLLRSDWVLFLDHWDFWVSSKVLDIGVERVLAVLNNL